ncbi:M1 family aminopeptidase [Streptomyces sp. NPDC059455]|uniref:M1 family aminopeptidase n=1 Tax=Streptomyces sp. NPDC059455 TaxID=3346837 RepID=UPI0036D154A9
MREFHEQEVRWSACEFDAAVECATIKVPLDYADPDGRRISIAVSRQPAADPASRRGVLLANPGGPGGSGLTTTGADGTEVSWPKDRFRDTELNEHYMTLDVVVHEQSHEWYGNAVADDGEVDSCLSECLASYATWLWDEEKDGVDLDSRYREQVKEHKDDTDWWQRLYRPDKPPGISTYNKGPLALHALRRQVGESAFHRIIKEWPQTRRGTYASWPDFESFAEKISGQDLGGFLTAWFHDDGVPEDAYLWPGDLKP